MIRSFLVFAALAVSGAVPTVGVWAAQAKEANRHWVTVGSKAAGLSQLPRFTLADGKLKPEGNVNANRHRLLVFCESNGGELADEVENFIKRIPDAFPEQVQLCLVFAASEEQMANVLQRFGSGAEREGWGRLADALVILGSRKQHRKILGVEIGKPFPGMELSYLLQSQKQEIRTPAMLLGESGRIEWLGDLTWADGPMKQWVAGTWDRSVTELACRLSKVLFFELRFFVDGGKQFSPAALELGNRLKELTGDAPPDYCMYAWGRNLCPAVFEQFNVNLLNPMMNCIEAESLGKRELALKLLVESTLAVDARVFAKDQYWYDRPVWALRRALRETIAISKSLAAQVSDAETKSRLASQQTSLSNWIKIVDIAQEGDFEKVEALIKALPKEDRQANVFGMTRCRVDACLIAGSAQAAKALRNVLEATRLPDKFTLGGNLSGINVSRYIANNVQRRLLEGGTVSDEMRRFATMISREQGVPNEMIQDGQLDRLLELK
jgi:hypothetical protein